VNEDVVTVWRNCLIYFTDTHERYKAAKRLSRAFDDAYHARITAPRHRERLSFLSTYSLCSCVGCVLAHSVCVGVDTTVKC
jgi:hypothetical protein